MRSPFFRNSRQLCDDRWRIRAREKSAKSQPRNIFYGMPGTARRVCISSGEKNETGSRINIAESFTVYNGKQTNDLFNDPYSCRAKR